MGHQYNSVTTKDNKGKVTLLIHEMFQYIFLTHNMCLIEISFQKLTASFSKIAYDILYPQWKQKLQMDIYSV